MMASMAGTGRLDVSPAVTEPAARVAYLFLSSSSSSNFVASVRLSSIIAFLSDPLKSKGKRREAKGREGSVKIHANLIEALGGERQAEKKKTYVQTSLRPETWTNSHVDNEQELNK